MDMEHLELLLPSTSLARRHGLIHRMTSEEKSGVNCFSCSGVCCTFIANSMMTTPLETAEILCWLHEQGRLDDELIQQLENNVRRYRLDQSPPGDGKRAFMRRTYTCPFFTPGPKGCGLSRSVKPYGCLGFNPNRPDQTEGGDCASDQDLLAERERQFEADETKHNEQLRERFALDWQKLPMPFALLELIRALQAD